MCIREYYRQHNLIILTPEKLEERRYTRLHEFSLKKGE